MALGIPTGSRHHILTKEAGQLRQEEHKRHQVFPDQPPQEHQGHQLSQDQALQGCQHRQGCQAVQQGQVAVISEAGDN